MSHKINPCNLSRNKEKSGDEEEIAHEFQGFGH